MSEPLKVISEADVRAAQREACCLIVQAGEKLGEAVQRVERQSPEYFNLINLKVSLEEPLGRLRTKSGFTDNFYRAWKNSQAAIVSTSEPKGSCGDKL